MIYTHAVTRHLALLTWLVTLFLALLSHNTWTERVDHAMDHIDPQAHFFLAHDNDDGGKHHDHSNVASHLMLHISMIMLLPQTPIINVPAVFVFDAPPVQLTLVSIDLDQLKRPPKA